MVYRSSEKGQLYGVTYIDHNNKAVFNGSDLGKIYSAKALTQRFEKATDSLSASSDNIQQRSNEKTESPQIHTPTYLKFPVQTNFLETLQTASHEESGIKIPKRRKKRKKGRIIEQDQQLTL